MSPAFGAADQIVITRWKTIWSRRKHVSIKRKIHLALSSLIWILCRDIYGTPWSQVVGVPTAKPGCLLLSWAEQLGREKKSSRGKRELGRNEGSSSQSFKLKRRLRTRKIRSISLYVPMLLSVNKQHHKQASLSLRVPIPLLHYYSTLFYDLFNEALHRIQSSPRTWPPLVVSLGAAFLPVFAISGLWGLCNWGRRRGLKVRSGLDQLSIFFVLICYV